MPKGNWTNALFLSGIADGQCILDQESNRNNLFILQGYIAHTRVPKPPYPAWALG